MEISQTGCPQVGVLSPMLFNIYMSKLPLPPKDINITSYADYLTVTTSHAQVEKLRDLISPYLNTLHDWLKSIKLKLSAEKSSATVMKTWSKEGKFDPHPTINNSPIPVKSKFKVLGVTFGSMLNLREHVRNTKEKLQKSINILKKIAGSDWGDARCTKETLSVSYKAIG